LNKLLDAQYKSSSRCHDLSAEPARCIWLPVNGSDNRLVFNTKAIGKQHILREPRLGREGLYISNAIHDVLVDHGITGCAGAYQDEV